MVDPDPDSPAERIRRALRAVEDPELGVSIVDLGLVYGVTVDGAHATVRMTMTTPTCPLGPYFEQAVEAAVLAAAPDVERVSVQMVWEPPWDPSMMSPDVRSAFGAG